MTGFKITTSNLTITMILTPGKGTGAMVALKRLLKSDQPSTKLSMLELIFTKHVHTETTPQTLETAQRNQKPGSLNNTIVHIQKTNSIMEQSGLLILRCKQVHPGLSQFFLTGKMVLLVTGLSPPGESLLRLQ